MRPLLDGEGFRQRIASLFRGVDVGQLHVLMTVYGLTHTGNIDPVHFGKVTELRGEAASLSSQHCRLIPGISCCQTSSIGNASEKGYELSFS